MPATNRQDRKNRDIRNTRSGRFRPQELRTANRAPPDRSGEALSHRFRCSLAAASSTPLNGASRLCGRLGRGSGNTTCHASCRTPTSSNVGPSDGNRPVYGTFLVCSSGGPARSRARNSTARSSTALAHSTVRDRSKQARGHSSRSQTGNRSLARNKLVHSSSSFGSSNRRHL